MDLASYSDVAIDLANLQPYGKPTDQALRTYLLDHWPWEAENLTPDVFDGLRELHRRLREAMIATSDDEAVHLLNRLLRDYPICPEISGHPHGDDDPGLHLHLSGPDVGVVGHAGAVCAMGLTSALLDTGMGRRGRCDHGTCDAVFIDGSPRGNRRYCGQSCQNRANVAAHRARKRAERADG